MTVDTLHAVLHDLCGHSTCNLCNSTCKKQKNRKKWYASWKKKLKTVVGVHGYWENRIK